MKASEFIGEWRKRQRELDPECKYDSSKDGWIHPAYKIEVDKIANTILPDICYSKDQGFNGIGLVGVLGDIALYSSSSYGSGGIFELGCGTSSIYLTALGRKYDRKLYHVDSDPTKMAWGCCSEKHISPNSEVFVMLSDEFFKDYTLPPIAYALIDGGHEYEQAKRDFWNIEQYVIENGYILLHDTYPPLGEDTIQSNMCWDCYRLRQDLEKDKRFDCLSFALGGQIGFTLVRKKPINRTYYHE